MTEVFITKYALTKGVYRALGEIKGDMFICRATVRGTYDTFFHGNDWHLTVDAAIERAEEMRVSKLKSLDKQKKKLLAIIFEVK